MVSVEKYEDFSSTSWPHAFIHQLHGRETEGKDCVKKQISVTQFLLSKGRHTKTFHMHVHHSGFCSLNTWARGYLVFPEIIHTLNLDHLDCFLQSTTPPLSLSLSNTQTHHCRHMNIRNSLTFWEKTLIQFLE